MADMIVDVTTTKELANELASTIPSVPGVADIHVEPDKVLEVAKIVEDQANALQDKLTVQLDELHIDPPGADAISTKSVAAWNDLIADGAQSYAKQVRAYLQNLRDLVEQLRAAAKTYHVGEAAAAARFGDRHAGPA